MSTTGFNAQTLDAWHGPRLLGFWIEIRPKITLVNSGALKPYYFRLLRHIEKEDLLKCSHPSSHPHLCDIQADNDNDQAQATTTDQSSTSPVTATTRTREEVPGHLVTSPDINALMMPQYINKRARLVGELIKVLEDQNRAILKTSDGIDVSLTYDADWDLWGSPTKYITAVGKVVDPQTMHLESFINMGKTVDLSTVEATIQIIHDPRFKNVFFPFRSSV
ncbi:hypothetical protein VNI00_017354 [Paramarasmius palmivorus]|uniref:Uncharacterized protein n=1 Tax=Paramarasmius palmivorus TaxID=297713 RepID=A0AAW0B685_9AGAR